MGLACKVNYGTGTKVIDPIVEVETVDGSPDTVRVYQDEDNYEDFHQAYVERVWQREPGTGESGGLKAER